MAVGLLRKPWMLRPNGDPGELLQTFLRARNPSSIAFTKVEAHVEEEFRQVLVPEARYLGNKAADEVAKEGRKAFPALARLFAADAAERLRRYRRRVASIQAMFIRMFDTRSRFHYLA